MCSVKLLEDALSFTVSHSLREPEVLEEQWTWFLEASAWSIRRLHDTVMVTVQATSQSTAPLTTIVVTPFPVVLLPTISVPQSNFSLKKNVKWKFLKARNLQILPICLCKLHFLSRYSFVFLCMLYLCVSTLTVEVRSQCWASFFVFLHFIYLLAFETGSLIGPRAHQLARLPESLCLSSNSELEAWLLTRVLLI